MKLNILVFAAHPDDAELGCGGTLALHADLGKKIGVVDLTRGELGTRGTPEMRDDEAAASAKILGLTVRENLKFRDGFFCNDEAHQMEVVRVIRQYQPEVILANAVTDRHPDHGKAAALISDACFLSGLKKVRSEYEGKEQEAWRPRAQYHYIQSRYIDPDFVVDITGYWDRKLQAIQAFKSQFYNPESEEPSTFISTPEFLKSLEARALELGHHHLEATHAEGFTTPRKPMVKDLFKLI